MPESRESARKRAKEHGFGLGQVICLEEDNWCYIAPHGIRGKWKRMYAELRKEGHSAESAARITRAAMEGEDK